MPDHFTTQKNLIPIKHICGRQCSTRKTESISFYSNVKICRVERTEIWNFLFWPYVRDALNFYEITDRMQIRIRYRNVIFFCWCSFNIILGHNSSISSCSRFVLNDHPTSYHIVYRSIYSVYSGKSSCL